MTGGRLSVGRVVTHGEARRTSGVRPRAPRASASLATLAIVAIFLVACGGSSDRATVRPPSVQHRQLTLDGQSRSYRLFVPPTLDLDHESPLVLVLHGGGNTGESMVQTAQFDREASAGGFLVAYPEGLERSWNAGFCCGRATVAGVDDIGFLIAMIDQVAADVKVDSGRVFAVGVSNGAMMAYRLACERSDRIAGVGSVAGYLPLHGCRSSTPVSILEIHGTADPLVPFEGGSLPPGAVADGLVPASTAVAESWASRNLCQSPPARETVGVVRTTTWRSCEEGSVVRLVAIDGGGHIWFATGLGPTNGAIDATQAIWDFLSGIAR